MPKILDRLPWLTEHEMITVQGERVRLKPFQIIVWVSVHMKGIPRLEFNTPRFPAILDTGNNHTFTVTERQLVRWAGIHPKLLPTIGSISLNRIRMERRAASVWIHRNDKGRRHELKRDPYLLQLRQGIAIHPDSASSPGPRLPLLGLRALDENSLDLRVNSSWRQVWLRTPTLMSRIWPAGR